MTPVSLGTGWNLRVLGLLLLYKALLRLRLVLKLGFILWLRSVLNLNLALLSLLLDKRLCRLRFSLALLLWQLFLNGCSILSFDVAILDRWLFVLDLRFGILSTFGLRYIFVRRLFLGLDLELGLGFRLMCVVVLRVFGG